MENQVIAKPNQILVFKQDDLRCALHLSSVDRVVRAVEVVPLPHTPNSVLGVVNFHGEIVPVVDIRSFFELKPHQVAPSNLFILAQTTKRLVVLVVDEVIGVDNFSENEMADSGEILMGSKYLKGIVKLHNNLILICDLDQFLSQEEEKKLDTAIADIAEAARSKPSTEKEAVQNDR